MTAGSGSSFVVLMLVALIVVIFWRYALALLVALFLAVLAYGAINLSHLVMTASDEHLQSESVHAVQIHQAYAVH